jgi:hypothetical protein
MTFTMIDIAENPRDNTLGAPANTALGRRVSGAVRVAGLR